MKRDRENTFEFESDRVVNTTDTNEYAVGLRDETGWDEELVDSEIPLSDIIPDMMDESGEGERPLYDESGFGERYVDDAEGK